MAALLEAILPCRLPDFEHTVMNSSSISCCPPFATDMVHGEAERLFVMVITHDSVFVELFVCHQSTVCKAGLYSSCENHRAFPPYLKDMQYRLPLIPIRRFAHHSATITSSYNANPNLRYRPRHHYSYS